MKRVLLLARLLPIPLLAIASLATAREIEVSWTDPGLLIEWSLPGQLVKIELFRHGTFVSDLTGWIENAGSFQLMEALPVTGRGGDGYRVRITNDLESTAWGDEFEACVVRFFEPLGDEILQAGAPAGLGLEWEAWSVSLRADVYRGTAHVGSIAERIPAGSTSWTWTDRVPASWESGSDYRVLLHDDSGFYGWSQPFTVTRNWEAQRAVAGAIEPGAISEGDFHSPGGGPCLLGFEAMAFRAYQFDLIEDPGIRLDILDEDGEVVLSPDDRADDQTPGNGVIYWDCLEGGQYYLRLASGRGGSYALRMDELDGRAAAVEITSDLEIGGSLDYPGDVDFYFLRLNGNILYKNKCNVTVSGLDGVRLSLLEEDGSGIAETAGGSGSEAMLSRRLAILSGGRDLYYVVHGQEGNYQFRGDESLDAGLTFLNILVEEAILVGVGAGISLIYEASSD